MAGCQGDADEVLMTHDAFLGRALRDPATGLPNVPYLQLIRDWEERRGRRRHYAVRVLKISVTGGEERVRRSLGWRLIRTLRDSDFVASQGPSHFQVLLTSPDAEHVGALRARIENVIAEVNQRHPSDAPLHVSIELEGGAPDGGGKGEGAGGDDPDGERGPDGARWSA
jgi:GGDEF domain-containing protein